MNLKTLVVCLLAATLFVKAKAQDDIRGTIKATAGFTQDFPGLNGYTLAGEYILPVATHWDASVGAKYADMSGHPRTPTVGEYTKARSLDFNLYWVPVRTETQILRIGVGFTFSTYDINRSYPIYTQQADGKPSVSWPAQRSSGLAEGVNFIVDYEYLLPNTPYSIGVRGALYKAYDRTWFIGPTVGYRW